MGDNMGHLVVGGCHYDKHLFWGVILSPPLHSSREISSKELLQKKKITNNNYKRNSETMELTIALLCGSSCTNWIIAVGQWDQGNRLTRGESKELCSGSLCHLLLEILGNHLISLYLSVLNVLQRFTEKMCINFIKQCTKPSKLNNFIEAGFPRTCPMLVMCIMKIKEN